MRCPCCNFKAKTLETRSYENGTRRRYECSNCQPKFRFNTLEVEIEFEFEKKKTPERTVRGRIWNLVHEKNLEL